jgi:hypothetical protein
MSDAPAATVYSPSYTLAPACQRMLEVTGLSEAEAIEAFDKRDDAMIVPSVPARLYGVKWLDSGDCIFTSGELVRMEWRVDRSVPAEITLHMVLRLRSQLPAGPIGRQWPVDVVWSRIAESFGAPLTFQRTTPPSKRYTGRWDSHAARITGASGEDDPRFIVDGGFERSRDNVKYAWALDVEKYQAWLNTPSGDVGPAAEPTAAEIAAATRTVFARMQPAKLSRQVVVRADIGEATVRLLCSRCSIVEINDPPFFTPTMKCLHVFGAEIFEDQPANQLNGKEYLLPIHFITDIRPGSNIFIAGENAPQRSAVLPNDYKPGNRMSLRMIEMMLSELSNR